MAWSTSKHATPGDWRRRRATVLAEHATVCHVCGHPGSDEVDHVIPLSQGGAHDLDNLRPIHGQPCPTCGQRCHTAKTASESVVGKTTRRRTAERHPGLL